MCVADVSEAEPAAVNSTCQLCLNIADSAHFHISSVRTLAVHSSSSHLVIFSAGGRGQLCAWAADVTSLSSTIGRLRWLASHVHNVATRKQRKSTNHKQADLSDIRYMKVTTFSANDLDPDLPGDQFVVAIACSDGVVRLLWFDEAARHFSDVSKSDFHGNCVLELTHVIYRSATANRNSAVILSAGTDGRICVWDVTSLVTSFCRNRSNSPRCSSVNCCVANYGKSFRSLTETGFADVLQQVHTDSLQETEANDTQASFYGSSIKHEDTNACDRQTVFFNSFDDRGDLEESDASDRRAVFHGSSDTEASERLEPCCVISAHQSGVNSLAVRQRLSGALCIDIVFNPLWDGKNEVSFGVE